MAARQALRGLGVLITRPLHQAEELGRLVREHGGEPVVFPTIAIEALPMAPGAFTAERLAAFDLVIFVSPNAARIAMDHLCSTGGWPVALKAAAVGPGTAAELRKRGAREVITGQAGFDSESLLAALPASVIDGRRIAIVCGIGGREFLGRELQARGARVERIEIYRRIRPAGGMAAILPGWRSGAIAATVATSAEIVENLYAMAGATGADCVRETPMFVPHARVAAAARRLGTRQIMVAGVGDQAMVAGLETWFARLRPSPSET